jgi:hypothetical protein
MHPPSFRPSSVFISTVMAMFLATTAPLHAADDPGKEPRPDTTHGRALYDTACDKCHSQNIHWRDRRQATSWTTLVKEVTRWQRNASQRWEQADINDVAAYLNERFYHFPCPGNECVEKEASAQTPGK